MKNHGLHCSWYEEFLEDLQIDSEESVDSFKRTGLFFLQKQNGSQFFLNRQAFP